MPEQYPNERQYAQDALNREMMWTVAGVFGVSREPEQDMCGKENRSLHANLRIKHRGPRGAIVAHVFDRKHGKTKEVTVMEDSCCQTNFVHPRVVQNCHLRVEVVAPVTHATLKGSFESNQRVEINWYGQKDKGNSWFYVAPVDAPIQLELLVGMAFQYEYPSVFGLPALPGPALLNVQTKVKVGIKPQSRAETCVSSYFTTIV
ncbi:uncharacterized protein RSE6_06856 [Rhynchosporium secalis]|uniref:Uncharacterized protein n=1 Tax=Rhynchosporium secalis TaxID=38038 RepID=A0A1E1MBG9_RHYSE|nr:uncharacterized protein RSE6_06856 [Rhynchosporium secalis]